MPVETLVLSKRLFDHSVFFKLPNLKKLVIHPGTFSDEGVEELSKQFEVVIRE